MHWLIQENLYKEEGMAELLATFERFSIPYDIVAVDHAASTIMPDVSPAGPVMVCGTYALSRIAAKRGWWPGSFMNDNHEHRRWVAHWGGLMLNVGAETVRFADVRPRWNRTFIRPAADTKFFDGQVLDDGEIQAWRDDVVAGRKRPVRCSDKLGPDTLVTCGPALDVYREFRFFVVDGEIAGSTTYRVRGATVAMEDVDPAALEFARQAVAIWQPARGFALDVAQVPDGYRIVEVNCLNTAGFYGADVQRIVMAVEDMQPEDGAAAH